MHRAAASVPAKVVERCGRRSDGEFARFLHVSRGAARELEHHLRSARDLHLLQEEAFGSLDTKVVEVEPMLTGLGKRVQPVLVEKRVSTARTRHPELASS